MSGNQPTHDPSVPPIGDFLNTILDQERYAQPHISEYLFKKDVIGVLRNPFAPEALVHYSHYVHKLTNPLHVTADNSDEVLFTVPPLVGRQRATMATEGGVTADIFFTNFISRARELARRDVNQQIFEFLASITDTGNYYYDVIQPINEILARYGEKMDALPGITVPTTEGVAPADTTAPTNTFMDEYDDD